MAETHLKFNVNTGEFECSGSEKFIQASRDEFKQLLSDLTKTKQVPAAAHSRKIEEVDIFEGLEDTPPKKDAAKSASVVPVEYKDIFVLSGESEISIHTLPAESDGDYARMADAMLILLWAFHKFCGMDSVSSLDLVSSLRKSGAGDLRNFQRSVRIVKDEHMVTKTGVRRGTRYGLTAKGTKRASEIVAGLIAKTK